MTALTLFFVVQLALCFRAKRTAMKLIPAYIIPLSALLIIADFTGMLEYSGFISAKGIMAIALAIVAGISLIGEIAAWTMYGIIKRKRSFVHHDTSGGFNR